MTYTFVPLVVMLVAQHKSLLVTLWKVFQTRTNYQVENHRSDTAVYADAESNTDLDITCALLALRASTDGTPAMRKQRLHAYVDN